MPVGGSKTCVRLTPRVYDLDVPQVIFTDVRGSIAE